jgi:hypothetical protein
MILYRVSGLFFLLPGGPLLIEYQISKVGEAKGLSVQDGHSYPTI